MLEAILGKTLTPFAKGLIFCWDDGTRSPSTAPMQLPPDAPSQLILGSTFGLVERIDTSGKDAHLNQDLYGASGQYSKRALGDAHKIDLYVQPIQRPKTLY